MISSHQQPLDNSVPVLALVVHNLDVVQVGISPVHQPADEVQRDAVGKHDLGVDEFGTILAIHVTALHLRDLTIICEEHLPAETNNQSCVRTEGLTARWTVKRQKLNCLMPGTKRDIQKEIDRYICFLFTFELNKLFICTGCLFQ